MIKILSFMLAAGCAFAQAPLAFEVATVKPSAPVDPAALTSGKAHVGSKINASRVDIGTASLFRLICTAYRLKPYQVAGPEWLKTASFDIQAKIPAGGTAEQVPEMLRTLLEDRFGLKVHRESREQSVYALVVSKGGPKMEVSPPETATPPPAADAPKPQEMGVPTLQGDIKMTRTALGIGIEMPGGEIPGQLRVSMGPGQPPKMHLAISGTTMKSLADLLSAGVDRPVVDQTGLTGGYEVAVDISPQDAIAAARNAITFLPKEGGGGGDSGKGPEIPGTSLADPTGSSVFSAIQNLGLRLEPRKLPLEVTVVDRMDRLPSAN